MHEDILKFRKLCEILKTEKKYSNKKLYLELGVSDPTLAKLLKEDLNTIKPRASVLALVQDFIKKHIDDINYAGIKPDTKEVERLRKNLSDYSAISSKKKNEHIEPGTDPKSGGQIIDLL